MQCCLMFRTSHSILGRKHDSSWMPTSPALLPSFAAHEWGSGEHHSSLCCHKKMADSIQLQKLLAALSDAA